MTPQEMKKRTFMFAAEAIRFTQLLPQTNEGSIIGRQLIRSSSSVGSNYRSACRAKSTSDFVNKLNIVEEESDECSYWLELIMELGLAKRDDVLKLLKESEEITAIIVASAKTTKSRFTSKK